MTNEANAFAVSEIARLTRLLEEADKSTKQLLGTLEAVKISMELSEHPFYKGMEMLNNTLAKYPKGK